MLYDTMKISRKKMNLYTQMCKILITKA
jgi:hypothetical protein